MASDEDLVGRITDGDQRALGELLGRWNGPLHAFVARFTGDRDVEDLRQEVWMRVVRAAPRFDRSRRFSTWLFQIALNLCRDWGRRKGADPVDGAAAEQVLSDDRGPTAADAGLDARRLLALLPEAQRSAIILRHYHGLSEAEMAEVLGCPRGTVKSRLHQGVQRLLAIARADEQRSAATPESRDERR
jgi:RNA polymerase sigma-70 factor (ECF subfamily)